jgi:hypothetical protein
MRADCRPARQAEGACGLTFTVDPTAPPGRLLEVLCDLLLDLAELDAPTEPAQAGRRDAAKEDRRPAPPPSPNSRPSRSRAGRRAAGKSDP